MGCGVGGDVLGDGKVGADERGLGAMTVLAEEVGLRDINHHDCHIVGRATLQRRLDERLRRLKRVA